MPVIEIDNIYVYFKRSLVNPGYQVRGSYKLKTKSQIRKFLRNLWLTKDYIELCSIFKFTRSDKSQLEEIAAHNIMYKLSVFPNRTGDTDVNNNESKLSQFGYKILALLHK